MTSVVCVLYQVAGAVGEEIEFKIMATGSTRVLVIEDDKSIADLIEWTLSDAGYEVSCAASVAEARRNWMARLPDILVADLLLPDGLGTEVVDEISAFANGATPPLLVMSALPQACDYAEKAGADACMAKPFDIEMLLSMIGGLVDGLRGQPKSSPSAG